jgi:hypothetical protein
MVPSWYQGHQTSSTNQGQDDHSRSYHTSDKGGGHHRSQNSGYRSWQSYEPAAITSKPRNPPQAYTAEPAQNDVASQGAPAPAAGHQAQGLEPARSHVSQRLGERSVVPKDDAHYRLDKLAESKLIEEEFFASPI